jgi:hypothetical protein
LAQSSRRPALLSHALFAFSLLLAVLGGLVSTIALIPAIGLAPAALISAAAVGLLSGGNYMLNHRGQERQRLVAAVARYAHSVDSIATSWPRPTDVASTVHRADAYLAASRARVPLRVRKIALQALAHIDEHAALRRESAGFSAPYRTEAVVHAMTTSMKWPWRIYRYDLYSV